MVGYLFSDFKVDTNFIGNKLLYQNYLIVNKTFYKDFTKKERTK